jgi:hypothetical protein
MLSGKKISILCDKENFDEYHPIKDILKKHHAELCINYVNKDTIAERCCDHQHMCDCVIFDFDDPLAALSVVKRRCVGFASIMYMRKKLSDILQEFDWNCLQKFDLVINSPHNILSITDSSDVYKIYENEVIQSISSAIMIHRKRRDDYDKILNAFIENFSSCSNYIALTVIDENGVIVATSETFKNLFGENVVGAKANDFKNGYSSFHIGDTKVMRNAHGTHELKLVNSYVLHNGVIYYLETWEIISETNKYKKAIKILDNVIDKCKLIANEYNVLNTEE